MNVSRNTHLAAYLARFAAAALAAYAAVTALFLPLQEMLPAAERTALDFFEPYRSLGFTTVATQLMRALVLAAVLYPFYERVVRSRRAPLLLFTALWGLSLVGSIQPMPGSFEGLLYTVTGVGEHLLVLAAGALQAALLIVLFLPWQRRASAPEGAPARVRVDGGGQADMTAGGLRLRSYVPRFVLLYVAVYIVAGMLFYQLSGYEEALAEMEAFELFRPLESPAMGAAVFFGQFIRGSLLALMLFPFAEPCVRRQRRGGLLFFAVFFGTTALGGPVFIPDMFSGIGDFTAGEFFRELSAGVPEILVQILLFSLLFVAWMRRGVRRRSMKPAAETGTGV
jgi:hypothetical protein